MKVAVLGAAGKLGQRIVESALARGHEVTAVARNFGPPGETVPDPPLLHRVVCDLGDTSALEAALAGQDAMISAAGNVADEHVFIALFDHIVSTAERVMGGGRIWMLGGALVLDMPSTQRTGTSLPFTPKRYGPHLMNWRRLERSTLDWALMCPGPMKPSDAPPNFGNLRMSTDVMPFEVGGWARYVPPVALSLVLKSQLPRLRVPYRGVADAMTEHLDPGGTFSRKRVGLGWIDPPKVAREKT